MPVKKKSKKKPLPKKTKLGRSRDRKLRSKEAHEVAYQKRKKKATKKKK